MENVKEKVRIHLNSLLENLNLYSITPYSYEVIMLDDSIYLEKLLYGKYSYLFIMQSLVFNCIRSRAWKCFDVVANFIKEKSIHCNFGCQRDYTDSIAMYDYDILRKVLSIFPELKDSMIYSALNLGNFLTALQLIDGNQQLLDSSMLCLAKEYDNGNIVSLLIDCGANPQILLNESYNFPNRISDGKTFNSGGIYMRLALKKGAKVIESEIPKDIRYNRLESILSHLSVSYLANLLKKDDLDKYFRQ